MFVTGVQTCALPICLRVEAGLCVVALRLFGADREVGHEDVGAGVVQDLRDVDLRRG